MNKGIEIFRFWIPVFTGMTVQNHGNGYYFLGRLKKFCDVLVICSANSSIGICFSSAMNSAVWVIKAGSLVFLFLTGTGDI